MKLNPLTLTFDRDDERDFLRSVIDYELQFVSRIAGVAAFAIFLVFLHRWVTAGWSMARILELVVIATIAAVPALTRGSLIRERPHVVGVVISLVILAALYALVWNATDARRPFMGGVFFVYMMAMSIVPMRLMVKLAIMAAATGGYIALHSIAGTYDTDIAALVYSHLAISACMAVGCSWILENNRRRRYMLERNVARERKRADDLLRNVLPESVANRLLEDGSGATVDQYDGVAVLFADVVGFTALTQAKQPKDLLKLLDDLFSRFDTLSAQYGVEKIKTIGDAYMAVAGAPLRADDACERIADLAIEIRDAVRRYSMLSGEPVEVRIGIHCGSVVGGVIGRQRLIYDLWGDTVNVASRIESAGTPGCVHASAEIARRLSERFAVECRGLVELKRMGKVETYYVTSAAEAKKVA